VPEVCEDVAGRTPHRTPSPSFTFAAGAILTMLVDTMMPEVFEHWGKLVGAVTTLGFAVAFTIHTSQSIHSIEAPVSEHARENPALAGLSAMERTGIEPVTSGLQTGPRASPAVASSRQTLAVPRLGHLALGR